MTSFLHKRIAIFASLVLAIGILAPSFIKLGHALYEHSKEQECISYGINHIHKGNLDCDFHDFTLVSKVLFNASFEYIPVKSIGVPHSTPCYSVVFRPFKIDFQALRGPPAASLSFTA